MYVRVSIHQLGGDAHSNGLVQTVVEINKSILRPEFLPQLFTCHDLARVLKQDGENLKRLFLEPNLSALLAQLSRTKIQLKRTEPYGLRLRKGLLHRELADL